jgi:hypothetical protein
MLKLLTLFNIYSMILCMESENILDVLKIGPFSIGSFGNEVVKNKQEGPSLDEIKRKIYEKMTDDPTTFANELKNYVP